MGEQIGHRKHCVHDWTNFLFDAYQYQKKITNLITESLLTWALSEQMCY